MQRTPSVSTLARSLDPTKLAQLCFVVFGAGAILASISADLLRRAAPSLGANQVGLALSGLALLIAGLALSKPVGARGIADWALVGAGVTVAAVASDLVVLGGLASFAIKQILLASIVGSIVVTNRLQRQSIEDVPQRESGIAIPSQSDLGKFAIIVAQLGLLVLLLGQFQLVNQAFYQNLMVLVGYGFVIHHFLLVKYRLTFFLLLSIVAILGILGVPDGLWLVAVGLALIGICHLPIAYLARIALLLAAAASLAIFRAGNLAVPWSNAVWPVLGSIFMFRLAIYVYDLRMHELRRLKEPLSTTSTLSYFFLLPNITFPLFPVVDFTTFLRSYYNQDRYRIYQDGLKWISLGAIHLLLYRFINYYLVIAPQDVTSVDKLFQYLLTNPLIILQISGHFHLTVGILHLFGFNLPKPMGGMFTAASFTDFWRRANVYWRDFMLKVAFYPVFLRMRSSRPITRVVVATVVVFILTWFLHAYQWYWLRGSFLLSGPDLSFWVIFGVLVLGNSLYEFSHGRKGGRGDDRSWRGVVSLALRGAAVFLTVCVLWSLWTSDSIPSWSSLFSVLGGDWMSLVWLVGLFAAVSAVFAVWLWLDRQDDPVAANQARVKFFHSAGITAALLLALYLVGNPAIYSRVGGNAQLLIADLRTSRLSDRDAAVLLQGYYQNLTGISPLNADLWEVYTKRPTDWPTIQETEAGRKTVDFRGIELVASRSILFHGERFTTNRWAMRDRDYELSAPPGAYRIALLGPSFVMGSGVADNEVFEARLEERLNRDGYEGRNGQYEILNFGVAGYSVLHQLSVVEGKVLEFRPDAIFHVGHDFEEEHAVRYLALKARTGASIPYEGMREIAEKAGVGQNATQSEAERRLKPHGAELVGYVYQLIAATAREHGIVPVWVYMPTLERSVSEDKHAGLVKLAEGAGFTVLDMSDIYQNQDKDSLIVAYWDRHPNAKGHQLLADRLYQELRQDKTMSSQLSAFRDTP